MQLRDLQTSDVLIRDFVDCTDFEIHIIAEADNQSDVDDY